MPWGLERYGIGVEAGEGGGERAVTRAGDGVCAWMDRV
jgi:hypothetical protein